MFQKDVPNIWILSNTVDIFDELNSSKSLEINNDGCLILPLSMQGTSKNRLININISIPLKNVEFKNGD
jgi:hypothetical protein